jgi:hypothetical protein
MFLCRNGFYTFQGFQGYLICNFWPSILFSIDFTICSRNLEFESDLKLKGFDWILTEATWLALVGWNKTRADHVDLASQRQIWAVGTDPRARRKGVT